VKPADGAHPGRRVLWIPTRWQAWQGEGGEVSAGDFGGKALMDGCLLIAGSAWIVGIQYNALLWV